MGSQRSHNSPSLSKQQQDQRPNVDGNMPTRAGAPPPLPPLTSVWVVLRHAGARGQVAALPHVVAMISDSLDYALPQFWSLPRACETNIISLLPRLVARGISTGVDPFYWAYQCRQALVSAMKHDNLEMVELLHELCPTVLPYLPMVETARTGNVRMLKWLSERHESVVWLSHMMDAAASTGQLKVLQWLHAHPKNARCSSDAFGSAIRGGYLDTVKWILANYSWRAVISWRAYNDATSSQYREVVQFLFEHTGIRRHGHNLSDALDWFARHGDLKMVQWLYAKSTVPGFSREIGRRTGKLINHAARGGYLHVVQWLHEHHPDNCTTDAMDSAAENGHLEVVRWLHENRSEGCTTNAMSFAAHNGHLKVVQWLHVNRTEGGTEFAMDLASADGHLEVVQWLHEHRTEGCSSGAMNLAARGGHLDIVKWLHENRTEGCTSAAMDHAAGGGHLDVIKWLHANRTEGCTIWGMTEAAGNGHLDVVKWLHKNRSEGCTVQAMDLAASSGHLDVIKWLHENRSEGCTTQAMRRAAANGHFDVLLFLRANRSEGYGAYIIEEGEACIQHMEIVQWMYAKHPLSINLDRLEVQGGSFMPRVLDHILGRTSAV